ncbi:MAG: LysM peptidoglycan-binding domain-containing protein [Dehalococcoidia bacterium]|nr:LysM peptidoglycan-binding domain-containing protein [Dehalococcoidia bacterium]
MRLRTFALRGLLLPLVAGALLLAACGGDDDSDSSATPGSSGTSTPAPTATPLARVPDPIVVTGDGSPGGGGASEGAATYVVEAGDSLGAIASRFGVSIEVIQQANDIDGVDIFIGQELVIPRGSSAPGGGPGATATPTSSAPSAPSAPSGVDTYTVEAGDTAFGIALQFDTTVEDLATANDMTEDEITDLQIGQVLRLPRPQ